MAIAIIVLLGVLIAITESVQVAVVDFICLEQGVMLVAMDVMFAHRVLIVVVANKITC